MPQDLLDPKNKLYEDNPYWLRPKETPEAYKARTARTPTDTTPAAPTTPTASTEPSIRLPRYESPLTPLLAEEKTTIETRLGREREDVYNLLTARLAEIDRRTTERIRETEQRGAGEFAKARSVSIRSGLAGSEFGEALREETKGRTRKEVAAEQERGEMEKAGMRGQVQVALGEIERRAEERLSGIRKEQAGVLEKQSEMATKDFLTLAKGGIGWDKIKRNQQILDELKTQTGREEGFLEILYKANAPKTEVEGFNVKTEGGKAVFSWFNKTTGKVEYKIEDLGLEDKYTNSHFDADTGSLVLWDKEGNSVVKDMTKKGFAPKPTTITTDAKAIAYDEIKQKAAQIFQVNKEQNQDKMISPEIYEQARNELKQLGLGSHLDDFDRAFRDLLSDESKGRFGIPIKASNDMGAVLDMFMGLQTSQE